MVTAAAVIIDPMTSNETLIIINQALYNCDPEQHESLLHSDQARFHGVIINDIAACYIDEYGNQGRQNLYVEGQELPLHHDGVKYYLRIRPPTPDDWKTKQIVELMTQERIDEVEEKVKEVKEEVGKERCVRRDAEMATQERLADVEDMVQEIRTKVDKLTVLRNKTRLEESVKEMEKR